MSYEKKKDDDTKVPSTTGSKKTPHKRGKRPPKGKGNGVGTAPAAKSFNAIPEGFGISVPRFLEANQTDENTFIPLGFTFGYFLPLGDTGASIYPNIADSYSGRIIARLKQMGYPNTYSTADIRSYLNAVAKMIQAQRFVYHIRTLNNVSAIHTARPISAMCSAAINGRMIALHRTLTRTLESIPYPQQFVQAMLKGLDATTLSDTPNSPIRIFAPKDIQPATGAPFTAANIITFLENVVNNFFAVPGNVELTSILPFTGTKLEEFGTTAYTYNSDVVNNLLNLPFFDGTGPNYSPFYADNVSVPLFYRRTMSPYSLMTFSPDTDVLTPPDAGTVWSITDSLLDTSAQSMYVWNDGNLFDTWNVASVFQVFGTVWESDLTLNLGNSPSLTKVHTNLEAVASGMSSLLLTD